MQVHVVESMLGKLKEENSKMEDTIRQQHILLEQSTSRITELEESQGVAENQVRKNVVTILVKIVKNHSYTEECSIYLLEVTSVFGM